MLVELYDGKTLVGNELKAKLEEIKALNRFMEVVESLKEKKDFNLDDLKVKKAYVFDAAFGAKEEIINASSSIVYLMNEDQSIGILYNELPNGDHIAGQYLDKVNKLLTTITTTEEGKINISKKEVESSKLFFNDDEEDLPNNPNYVRGQFASVNRVNPQSWWTGDGCMWGGYQHCGPNCGYPPRDHGGGPPINATDECCVGHDRCWAEFGSNDPCCDKDLIDCVAGHTTAVAAGIRLYFSNNASKC